VRGNLPPGFYTHKEIRSLQADASVTDSAAFSTSNATIKGLDVDNYYLGLPNTSNAGNDHVSDVDGGLTNPLDVPIPFTLTDLGHLDVAAYRIELEQRHCEHEWKLTGCSLTCSRCDRQGYMDDGRPTHLAVKKQ
jgi:hypothetical protein